MYIQDFGHIQLAALRVFANGGLEYYIYHLFSLSKNLRGKNDALQQFEVVFSV